MFPGVGHVVNGVGHVVNTSGVNRAPATNNPQPLFTLNNGEEGSSSWPCTYCWKHQVVLQRAQIYKNQGLSPVGDYMR